MQKEVKYGTELHGKIVAAIRQRRDLSQRKMSERYEEWNRVEKEMVSYQPAKEVERRAKDRKGESDFTQLKIPYSYGMMLTSHTYYSGVFMGRDTIHQVQGLHGEGQNQVLAHEALMNYQVSAGKHRSKYFVWLLDVAKYGVGILGDYWDKELRQIAEIVEEPVDNDGVLAPGRTEKRKQTRRVTGFEGNKVYNVRPFDFFPDPRVSLMNFQEGEFCGRQIQVGWNMVVKGAEAGKYFNLEALRSNNKGGATANSDTNYGYGETGDNAALIEKLKRNNFLLDITKDKNYVLLTEMCVEIIPKDWDLGESGYPEKWVFTLGNDDVLIGAQPLGLLSDRFPFSVLEREVDGHGLTSRGLPSVAYPLQQTMDWLANSHFYNVQKTLNNELLVDPSRITMADLKDPKPGKLVRLRPAAYGTNPKDAVHQLSMYDQTRGHLGDMKLVEALFQRVFGISESMMGAQANGGRKTATEVRSATSFGINRLKTDTEFFSATGWSELTQALVQNNAQLYSGEKKFRIAGSNIMAGQEQAFIDVNPEALAGFYEVMPVDGTLPIDRFALSNLWKEILMGARHLPPQIQQGYDWAGIFAWTSKLSGLKNIDTFAVEQPAMMPDGEIQAEAQAGNLVPSNQIPQPLGEI